MAKYFWTYETDLPAGTGFSLYGRQHIIWMLVLFMGVVVIGALYKMALAGERTGFPTGGKTAVGRSAASAEEGAGRGSRRPRTAVCAAAEEGFSGRSRGLSAEGAEEKDFGRRRQERQTAVCGTAGEKPACRIRFAAAFAAMFLQVIQGVYRIVLGVYDVGTLPLHICSIASYAVFVHCLLRKPPKWFSEILFFPLLPGALCAILFPDWTHYPAFSFMSCAGFLVHGAIVLYIMLRMADGTVQPSPKRAWAPALFLAVYAVCLIPFDRHFQVNYGFLLTPSPGSPLMFIADIFGTGAGYLFGFGLLVFAVMLLCYALAGIGRRFHHVNQGTVL